MTKILIIEDDDLTRANLKLMLEMEGFAVLSAEEGQAGLELAQREAPDLVLCDVSMPGLDGHEVLRALRADPVRADVPFIFLTARGERHQQRAGMNLGADDYLCKPVEVEDLLAAINTRLSRHLQTQDAAVRDLAVGPDFTSAVPLEELGLTPREAEVLLWVAQGKANSDVATILSMSEKTVKIHLYHIFDKLGVETRTSAARTAMETLSRARRPGPAGEV